MVQSNSARGRRRGCLLVALGIALPFVIYAIYIYLCMYAALPGSLYRVFSDPFDKNRWQAEATPYGVFFLNPRYHMLSDLLADDRLHRMSMSSVIDMLGAPDLSMSDSGYCSPPAACYRLGMTGFPSIARITLPNNLYYIVALKVYQPDPSSTTKEYTFLYCPDTR